MHQTTLVDDYHWMKDDNWQEVLKDPSILRQDIRDYLEAENAYTADYFSASTNLQKSLYGELHGRIQEDDSSIPLSDGQFSYWKEYVPLAENPRFCRQNKSDGIPHVLLDGNIEAKGKPFYKIIRTRHSPDHKYFAWAVDTQGSERYTIFVKDIESGTIFPTAIHDACGDFVWGNDSAHIYYTEQNSHSRPWRVYCFRLTSVDDGDDAINSSEGEDQEGIKKRSVLVYEEEDAGYFMHVSKSQDGQCIFISCYDQTTSEVRVLLANRENSSPLLLRPRERDFFYRPVHFLTAEGQDAFFLLTNALGAEDMQIMSMLPEQGHDCCLWQSVVPPLTGRCIVKMVEFANFLVRLERTAGLPRIVYSRLDSGEESIIEFEEACYDLDIVRGYEHGSSLLHLVYSSMTTPTQHWVYDMQSGERRLLKSQIVPSGHRVEEYVTSRLHAIAADGTQIPVSLLYHQDLAQDEQKRKSAPVLLYGYGSYGIAIPASFSTHGFSLVNRGFIYAIAHIRGGSEGGQGWYLQTKCLQKKKTFEDYICCAEMLQSSGMGSRCYAHGASAGGMLMGAVYNMRPDLWAGVVAEVPFVDVLNTMTDLTLPLTPPEWPEWGNPLESVEAFHYIRSYSPYDNIRTLTGDDEEERRPPLLAMGGLTDPRVTYWEPAKWIAKLRAHSRSQDSNALLLKINMSAGHGGSAGRYERLQEIALVYAFVLELERKSE